MAGCSRKPPERWTPPEHPDPKAILDEAREDADAKRYENALAKHVWFHQNALKIEPAQYGVRLSFALSSWMELGKSYPPALEKLKAIRDDAGSEIREGKVTRDTFHDFEAISKALGEESKTSDLFLWLDSHNPDFARSAFEVAKPSLIKAKEFRLCGVYLDPDGTFKRMRDLYRHHKELAQGPRFGKDLLEFGHKSFSNEAATLVALLSVNGRKEEANRIAAEAAAEYDDPKFRALLEKAKNGEVPVPWP